MLEISSDAILVFRQKVCFMMMIVLTIFAKQTYTHAHTHKLTHTHINTHQSTQYHSVHTQTSQKAEHLGTCWKFHQMQFRSSDKRCVLWWWWLSSQYSLNKHTHVTESWTSGDMLEISSDANSVCFMMMMIVLTIFVKQTHTHTHTHHRKLNIWGHVGNFIRCRKKYRYFVKKKEKRLFVGIFVNV